MKKVMMLMVSVLMVSAVYGQDKKVKEMKPELATIVGFAQDNSCASHNLKDGEKGMTSAMKHSKSCALEEECSASGFGVWSDNKYYKLDDAGNKMMLKLYGESDTKKGMKVSVKGEVSTDMIKVSELKEVKDVKMEKKS